MDGLGKQGLTETFEKLSTLGYALSLAALVGVAAPWLEQSALLEVSLPHMAVLLLPGPGPGGVEVRGRGVGIGSGGALAGTERLP